MSDFLIVEGDDLRYKTRRTLCFLSRSSISVLYPMWAVEQNGEYWRCTEDHPKAKLRGFEVVDFHGRHFQCVIEEAKKVLSEEDIANLTGTPPEKKPLGFVRDGKPAAGG